METNITRPRGSALAASARDILTVLTAPPGETTEANALVGVQLGVAAAAVVAGLLGARVVLEHGYVAGAHGVLLSEDGGAHENDLEQENRRLKETLPRISHIL